MNKQRAMGFNILHCWGIFESNSRFDFNESSKFFKWFPHFCASHTLLHSWSQYIYDTTPNKLNCNCFVLVMTFTDSFYLQYKNFYIISHWNIRRIPQNVSHNHLPGSTSICEIFQLNSARYFHRKYLIPFGWYISTVFQTKLIRIVFHSPWLMWNVNVININIEPRFISNIMGIFCSLTFSLFIFYRFFSFESFQFCWLFYQNQQWMKYFWYWCRMWLY